MARFIRLHKIITLVEPRTYVEDYVNVDHIQHFCFDEKAICTEILLMNCIINVKESVDEVRSLILGNNREKINKYND